MQQIGLERRERALQRAAELTDHAPGRGEQGLARPGIVKQFPDLLYQHFLRIRPSRAAGGIEGFIDVGKIEDVGTVDDRRAELDRLDRILSAMLDQRSAHEHDRRQPVEQSQFAHGVGDIDIGGGDGQFLARAQAGLQASLRSREELPTATTDIYVADTMGELGLFYRLSPIVFMGGSLIPHGGQNPIEAVKLGASIVHGPHVFNFSDVYEALDAAGGARRADSQEALVKQLGQLLADPKAREASLAASERVVEQLGGALQRTLAALEPYLLQLRIEMGAANA